MSKGPAITRVIQVDDKHITVHIHLTEEEIQRLVPQIMKEMDRQLVSHYRANIHTIASASTTRLK